MPKTARSAAFALLAAALLPACERQPEPPRRSGPPPAVVTVAPATGGAVEVLEHTVGHLESLIDPKIGAEVAGRVVKVHAHAGKAVKAGDLLAEIDPRDIELERDALEAEIKRVEALLDNQRLTVERQRRLVAQQFISRNALDEAQAQEKALAEQLAGARARLAQNRHNATKTRVLAPIDARVETQIVAVGDYVKVGDPMFFIVGTGRLRAHLPFPESVASRLRLGLPVRMSTPTAPDEPMSGVIEDIKPVVGAGSRAVEAMVRFDNAGGWKPGASVDAAVLLERRDGAVLVPESSVVQRPAGSVVYTVEQGVARQRVVRTGVRRDGQVEIVSGLAVGETVAVDGAGFLTDGAAVSVRQEVAQQAQAAAPPK